MRQICLKSVNFMVALQNFRILRGYFSPKALGLIMEWAEMHKEELMEDWELAANLKHTFGIEPLK